MEGGVVSQVFRQEDDEAANLRISSADMGGEKKTPTTWQFLATFLECFSDPNSKVVGDLQSEDQTVTG